VNRKKEIFTSRWHSLESFNYRLLVDAPNRIRFHIVLKFLLNCFACRLSITNCGWLSIYFLNSLNPLLNLPIDKFAALLAFEFSFFFLSDPLKLLSLFFAVGPLVNIFFCFPTMLCFYSFFVVQPHQKSIT